MKHSITIFQGMSSESCPPLPPYPDDGEDEGIYRPEDEDEQP